MHAKINNDIQIRTPQHVRCPKQRGSIEALTIVLNSQHYEHHIATFVALVGEINLAITIK